MLSDRISKLFDILGCNNTDIARCVDCSPSNISRMHSGGRSYRPKDRSIVRFAEGVYVYADNLNLLPLLCGLCRIDGESREELIPALIAWLFDTDEASLPELKLSAKRKTIRESIREQKCRSFGERLNAVMELLDMSNMQLARQINVDSSHISRFRSGVRSPKQSSSILELLTSALLKRAVEQNRLAELTRLTTLPLESLQDEKERISALSSWLYGSSETDTSDIDHLLDCINSFSPDSIMPLPELSTFVIDDIISSDKTEYWGVDGLREAVVRFLGNTAKSGGELWLYSDENIGWMVDDKAFFAKWFSLMTACVKRGVRVRIVHNIDRGTPEMISAIQSWLPLYMSGMIEAFVCRRGRDARFTHTVFLRPRGECVYASHISSNNTDGWYDYITDERKIKAIADEYESLIAQSEPLVRIVVENSDELFEDNQEGDMSSVLSSLSLGTMPKKLITSMLERNGISAEDAVRTAAFCKALRCKFAETLAQGSICEFLTLPSDEELFAGKVRVNLSPSLCNTDIYYTPEEYAIHIQAIYALLGESAAYHFYALPELPFDDIQIIKNKGRVTVIRSKLPYAAFVFTEPVMLSAFDSYFDELKKRYKCDRKEVRRTLRNFM